MKSLYINKSNLFNNSSFFKEQVPTFAIIGFGRFSKKAFLQNLPTKAKLVAIVDPNSNALDSESKEILAKFGAKFFVNENEMLNEIKVDFVVICTPHDQHFNLLKTFVNKGIHVLKEKPFAFDLSHAKLTMELLKQNPLVQMAVIPKRRFDPMFVFVKQCLGKIGKLFCYNLQYTLSISDLSEGWRACHDLAGGGCLKDMGYHYIDLMTWLFKEPAHVDCNLSYIAKPNQNYNVEDTCIISLKYANGLIGTTIISRCLPPESEMVTVYGQEGTVYCDGEKVVLKNEKGETFVERSFTKQERKTNAIDEFVDVLSGRIPPITTIEEQYLNQEVIEHCYNVYKNKLKADLKFQKYLQ